MAEEKNELKTTSYCPPSYKLKSFHCPQPGCGVYTQQSWYDPAYWLSGQQRIQGLDVAYCYNCKQYSIWFKKQLLYPNTGDAPPPNPDLSSDVLKDYEEARDIVTRSPRGAAALLRLAIQKLCIELGQKGKNLNKDIGSLVKKGLSKRVQKALDVVRVIGNNAVHPGEIDLRDNREIANALFGLVNLIVEQMVSTDKHVDKLYGTLPPEVIDGINDRDSES